MNPSSGHHFSKLFCSGIRFFCPALILIALFTPFETIKAKKIKQSLKIKKEKTDKSKIDKEDNSVKTINIGDSTLILSTDGFIKAFFPEQVSFAGYEKEANSTLESFIVVNKSSATITGFTVEIAYQDMQGRMLHRRKVELVCEIPENQSRKFDIKSWDKQRTYYYYRGNSPRKTATPYKVEFIPVSFQIRNQESLTEP